MSKYFMVFLGLFYACSGSSPTVVNDTTAPTAKTSPASGANIKPISKVTITFSESMDKDSLEIGGSMLGDSDGGTWSTNEFKNDTLTIDTPSGWTTASTETLTIDAKDTSGNPVKKISLAYDISSLTLNTFQSASVEIGQANFTAFSPNRGSLFADGATINNPFGNPAYYQQKLFLPDYDNRRVLLFKSIPTENGATADHVMGQITLTGTGSGDDADELKGSQGAQVYNGKLLINDHDSHRLLIFNNLPTSNGVSANVVAGQTSFNQSSSGVAADRIHNPTGFIAVAGKLIMADTENNRVLIWNTIPTSNGAAADIVLGQDQGMGSFGIHAENDSNHNGTHDLLEPASASTLYNPTGIWSDGTKLVVVDNLNNRVLIWNTFPTTNAQDADLVLGQNDFFNITENDDDHDDVADGSPSSKTLYHPFSVASNGTQLVIADSGNNRVLIWNTFPTTNFEPADVALGQADFTHGTENDLDQDNVDDGVASAKTMNYPSGVAFAGNNLIVTDTNNNRYLVFKGQ